MSLVDFYIFTSPQHLQEYHGDVKNILDYALEERLIDVNKYCRLFFLFLEVGMKRKWLRVWI